jgi:hypothetical protein
MQLSLLTGHGMLSLLRSQPVVHLDASGLAEAPWRVFGEQDVLEIRDPRRGDLRRLPAGTAVRLVVDRPGARRRVRRVMRRAGLVVERELIAVPSTGRPVALIDDHPDAVRTFWWSVVTPPPGLCRGWLAATLLIGLGRRLPWTWTGAVAPGRVVLGRKR